MLEVEDWTQSSYPSKRRESSKRFASADPPSEELERRWEKRQAISDLMLRRLLQDIVPHVTDDDCSQVLGLVQLTKDQETMMKQSC